MHRTDSAPEHSEEKVNLKEILEGCVQKDDRMENSSRGRKPMKRQKWRDRGAGDRADLDLGDSVWESEARIKDEAETTTSGYKPRTRTAGTEGRS